MTVPGKGHLRFTHPKQKKAIITIKTREISLFPQPKASEIGTDTVPQLYTIEALKRINTPARTIRVAFPDFICMKTSSKIFAQQGNSNCDSCSPLPP
jgi:hypothetical protein